MTRSRACATALALAFLAAASTTPAFGARQAYDRAGPYLDYERRPFITSQPPASGGPYRIDPALGVLERVPSTEAYLPSAADDAYHGLQQFTRWANGGRPVHLRRALQAGRWAAALQEPSGSFRYWYSYRLAGDPDPIDLTAPWHGAFTQGVTLSLYTRLYRGTGKRIWLRRARLSLVPLTLPPASGGDTVPFLGTSMPWFEGYASAPVWPHTLTHHVHTLVGLWDMADLSPAAARLFRRGIASLHVALPRYDLGSRQAVWLMHLTDPGRPLSAISGWGQEVMMPAMAALDSVTADRRIERYTRKWNRQLIAICKNPVEQCRFPHRRR